MILKKNYITVLLCVFTFATLQSQNIANAVRYSDENLGSSARYRALSGAFGSLGGDLSAISNNPAGAAIFPDSQGNFSLSRYDSTTKNTFLGQSSERDSAYSSFSQAGFVLVFNNPNKHNTTIERFTFGVNYDICSNFNTDYFIQGNNPTSIDKYFLYYAEGKSLGLLTKRENETLTSAFNALSYLPNNSFATQQAFLGYNAYIINPVSNEKNNKKYTSNIYSPNGSTQKYKINSREFSRITSLNFSIRIKKNIYFGINLNYHYFEDKNTGILSEYGYNNTSVIGGVNFKNTLITKGKAISFQMGSIIKITPSWRVGLSYRTPTRYEIEESLLQSVETTREDTFKRYIIAPVKPSLFQYKLRTPRVFSGSMSYIFGKKGFICFDYIFKDFSENKFEPDNSTYTQKQNNMIQTSLRGMSEFRLGGERKVEQWSFRGGMRFKGSPYKDQSNASHRYYVGDFMSYSLGLGYLFNHSALDLTYEISFQEGRQQFYDNINAFNSVFEYKKNLTNISLSYRILF